jgi:AraC-like DNA-binding protein
MSQLCNNLINQIFMKKILSNPIENRRKNNEQIHKSEEALAVEYFDLKSRDEILIQKVMNIVKDNISQSNLNGEMLADSVCISRVHMHRKLKALTNQSARDFIRNIRMKQAAYLLASKNMNISEVAYSVGYSSLSHFSYTFKTLFGLSPSEYILNQHKNIDHNKKQTDLIQNVY